MQQISQYAAETAPVYKCPSCRWHFSLMPPPKDPEIEIAEAIETLRHYAPYILAPEYQSEAFVA